MPTVCAFPITPADADGHVDVAALRGLLRPLVAAEVHSIGLLGSTGSYPFLSREERRRAVEAAVDEVAARAPLLVGVGALRTDEAVHIAQDAKAAGADVGLLAAVSYTPLTEDEVFEHFSTVARESGLPLCIYDNPGTTHFRFSTALVGRLKPSSRCRRGEKSRPRAAGHRRPSEGFAGRGARAVLARLQRRLELGRGADRGRGRLVQCCRGRVSEDWHGHRQGGRDRRDRRSAAPERSPRTALGAVQGVLQFAGHLRLGRSPWTSAALYHRARSCRSMRRLAARSLIPSKCLTSRGHRMQPSSSAGPSRP